MTIKELKNYLETLPQDAEIHIWKASWDDWDMDTSVGTVDENVWYSERDNALKFW